MMISTHIIFIQKYPAPPPLQIIFVCLEQVHSHIGSVLHSHGIKFGSAQGPHVIIEGLVG